MRLCRERPGAANAGRKVTALIYAMALGAGSILLARTAVDDSFLVVVLRVWRAENSVHEVL